ncbi:transcriptional regulator, TetR family [Pedobacter westerhofensis]|uniref:Transcriptional regulator, TetR family n=1 Tax=Pedobacter westerhofensis TaxID=425512 RepID=A0A521BQC6_9SPHI|nr:TetR/AcrR family transcriptional regulator [Pedobacter westerhofensis]SMO49374.1 transcriptional regulator, TetR family [Pedobacter westerhofensis]
MEEMISKAERTRQFIIETTANLFNKKGYAGTSMSDLTTATGLTKGSIYGNFENKEDVALAVFDYNHSRIVTEVKKRTATVSSFRDKLLVYADVYNHYTMPYFPEGGCPILNTAIEADDTNSLLKDRAAKAVIKWQKSIQEIIKSGITAGEFKKDTNPLELATSIVALIEGGIMISRVTDDINAFHRVMKTVSVLIDQIAVK